MSKPKLLDIGCCAGGCSAGYAEYFDVTGIDIQPQPRYPYRFIQADMMDFPFEGYDAYHASPPCQLFTIMLNHGLSDRGKHPNLVGAIRKRLQATGKPYVIENVSNAPLIKSIMLCGAMFGLRVYRHRWFESNVFLFQPEHPRHVARIAHAGNIPTLEQFYCPVGHMGDKRGAQRAMGIDWMHTQYEIAQAVPPMYTRYIAEQLIAYIPVDHEVAV